ncbi:MAG TPA: hypothetical protein VJS67_08845 [Pseudonocardiaceae bacterium]|nr:hypothetical protein [Pseudonocardiaceae bacterium]
MATYGDQFRERAKTCWPGFLLTVGVEYSGVREVLQPVASRITGR